MSRSFSFISHHHPLYLRHPKSLPPTDLKLHVPLPSLEGCGPFLSRSTPGFGWRNNRGDPASGRPSRCVVRRDTTKVISLLSLFFSPFALPLTALKSPTHPRQPHHPPTSRQRNIEPRAVEPHQGDSSPPPAIRTTHRVIEPTASVLNHTQADRARRQRVEPPTR
jgi:hypothetical protein